MLSYAGVRSRFFDDYFRQACDNGVRQAVILASGLDTRAFRLPWPEGMRVFEIDQPKVLEFKDTVLAERHAEATCTRHAVPCDLRDEWEHALTQAGFDAGQPTAWLAEGLLIYLPADAEEQLIDTIHRLSCPGSHVAIETFADMQTILQNTAAVQSAGQTVGLDVTELFSYDQRPSPDGQFADRGWTARREPGTEVAARYGRTLAWDTIAEGLNDMVAMLTAVR
jgi:methyltransferase (TIGR00027 family)